MDQNHTKQSVGLKTFNCKIMNFTGKNFGWYFNFFYLNAYCEMHSIKHKMNQKKLKLLFIANSTYEYNNKNYLLYNLYYFRYIFHKMSVICI